MRPVVVLLAVVGALTTAAVAVLAGYIATISAAHRELAEDHQ